MFDHTPRRIQNIGAGWHRHSLNPSDVDMYESCLQCEPGAHSTKWWNLREYLQVL